MSELNPSFPKHIAIIMDGNGRWATQRGKLRMMGHRAGLKSVRKVVNVAVKKGISALTLYAFSRENWNRPLTEVRALQTLFIYALNREIKNLHKNNIQLRVIGDISRFNEQLQLLILMAQQKTHNNTGMVLTIAANYSGRWDIIEATKKVIEHMQTHQLPLDKLEESSMAQYVSLSDLPEIDLVIRTGGEFRISNFLLWQMAYAELYFTETLWPDFYEAEFEKAIAVFQSRERRFGGTKESTAEVISC